MFPSSYHQPITFIMPDISPKIKIAESPKSPIVVLRRQDCSWESKPVDESSEEDDEDDDEEEVYFSMHATPPFLKTPPSRSHSPLLHLLSPSALLSFSFMSKHHPNPQRGSKSKQGVFYKDLHSSFWYCTHFGCIILLCLFVQYLICFLVDFICIKQVN